MFAGCIGSHTPAFRQSLASLYQDAKGLAGIPYRSHAFYHDNDIYFIQQHQEQAHQTQHQGIYQDPNSGISVLHWSRIDNSPDIAAKIGDKTLVQVNDAPLIVAAYLKWGEALCEHLIGDFAFAIWDSRQKKCLLAKDHLGVRPLYYCIENGTLLFATSLQILKTVLGNKTQLNRTWLVRYIAHCSHDWQQTPYNDIYKLQPAHIATWQNQQWQCQRYFQFSCEITQTFKHDQDYIEAYREQLTQAINCRMQGTSPIGTENSGGLDSSSITVIAAALKNNNIQQHTFSFVNSAYEEQCIDQINATAHISHAWKLQAIAKSPAHLDATWRQFHHHTGQVFEHVNAVTHIPFYDIAQKQGVRNLLSGFGGDEAVTASAGQARIDFLKNKQWRLLYNSMPKKQLRSIRSLKWISDYYRHASISSQARQFIDSAQQKIALLPLSSEDITQHGVDYRLLDEANWDSNAHSFNDFSINKRLTPVLTARLEGCSLMAAAYGIEYSWPLLDIRLLQYFFSVPAEQKLGPKGIGRYLHRRAIANILPDNLVWKEKTMLDPILPAMQMPFTQNNSPRKINNYQQLIKSNALLSSIIDLKKYNQLMAAFERGGNIQITREAVRLNRKIHQLALWQENPVL